uniref:Zinc finger Mcm10/DnaG-type domain-containing protein n=1 Tax=Kalanchoe fedtschenkoi TaxID=63787 RepID=A0A7N0U5W4_KALFE
MSSEQEDLDLLLSLQDRVLETPPGSPGYDSDDGARARRRRGQADMSAFRNAVADCLDYEPKNIPKVPKAKGLKNSRSIEVEKFSGLRIKNRLLSPEDISNHFADIRFVQFPAIKNLIKGDTLSGCWATVGVLAEKGIPRTSSVGKNYCIWKVGSLDENTVGVFLFGDAYHNFCKEEPGAVFAFFNGVVRKDAMGSGYSLSIFSASQILKMGTSVDYGVCKGKKRDGNPCTIVINKSLGRSCGYHNSKASQKYTVTRTELKGGNLKTAFREPLKRKGIYMVDPEDRTAKKSTQPLKVLSVDALKKALSGAGKVTTNSYSQGIRFLNEMAGAKSSMPANQVLKKPSSDKRPQTTKINPSSPQKSRQTNDTKGNRLAHGRPQAEGTNDTKGKRPAHVRLHSEEPKKSSEKMIELDIISSDDDDL